MSMDSFRRLAYKFHRMVKHRRFIDSRSEEIRKVEKESAPVLKDKLMELGVKKLTLERKDEPLSASQLLKFIIETLNSHGVQYDVEKLTHDVVMGIDTSHMNWHIPPFNIKVNPTIWVKIVNPGDHEQVAVILKSMGLAHTVTPPRFNSMSLSKHFRVLAEELEAGEDVNNVVPDQLKGKITLDTSYNVSLTKG